MALPFLFEENFELGTRGGFDSEADTDSKLDFPHYSTLAGIPNLPAPWRGAYCMHVNLALGTNDAYVEENTAFDSTTAGTLIYTRIMFWFGGSPVMASDDEFRLLEARSGSAGATVEYGCAINYTTTNGYRFGIFQGTASTTSYTPITLNRWHSLELLFTHGTGSTLDGWVDGVALTQIADFAIGTSGVTFGRVGTIGIDAGTTRGRVLFDDVTVDDLRLGPPERRFPQTRVLTASEHLFMGQGEIAEVALLSGGGTDNVLEIIDTDDAYTTDAHNIVMRLLNTANNQVVEKVLSKPIQVKRGAYVSISGTGPRALVRINRAQGYWSDAAIRNLGLKRTPRRPD